MNQSNRTANKKAFPRFPVYLLLPALCIFLAAGCVTTEEATRIQRDMTSLERDFYQFKRSTEEKLSKMEKEQENLSRQVVSMHASVDKRDEDIRTIMGKIDELDYQMRTYRGDPRAVGAPHKTPDELPPVTIKDPAQPVTPQTDARYEAMYKDAFENFQRGRYNEAVTKFIAFTETYGGTPLASNAYYWIGECYMNLKSYDKAILYFQEIIDKYPKSERAPRALLSQAEAFRLTDDKQSSITLLKRVIELYPKSEEARIAERKLRNPGL